MHHRFLRQGFLRQEKTIKIPANIIVSISNLNVTEENIFSHLQHKIVSSVPSVNNIRTPP